MRRYTEATELSLGLRARIAWLGDGLVYKYEYGTLLDRRDRGRLGLIFSDDVIKACPVLRVPESLARQTRDRTTMLDRS